MSPKDKLLTPLLDAASTIVAAILKANEPKATAFSWLSVIKGLRSGINKHFSFSILVLEH